MASRVQHLDHMVDQAERAKCCSLLCPRGNREMIQGSAGCRHTGKLQQQRAESFLMKLEETEESFLASQ